MHLFDTYPRFDIRLEKASGVYVYDDGGQAYLDLYGGHGVISIGHSHPHYVQKLQEQLAKIGFYSNSVHMPIQEALAEKLGTLSGYPDYALFLCNSGAEANENALKLASFHTGRKKFIAFKNSFHGRSAAALNVTDNAKLSAPMNMNNFPVEWVELNNVEQFEAAMQGEEVAAVIVEGIQGVGGLDYPEADFLELVSSSCKQNGSLLILDEIQSGFGRSGHFFAHQFAACKPDIISMAKGMGNGFPIGGVLISPEIKASHGLLGTTFGGNPLACAASLAVLEVLEAEQLMQNAREVGSFLQQELAEIPAIKKVKGRGLMLGVELDEPVQGIRKQLLNDDFIFTGASANPKLIRILPPLGISKAQAQGFVDALKKQLV